MPDINLSFLYALVPAVLALGYITVTLFASWGRRPPELTLTERVVPGSPAFLRAIAGLAQTSIDKGGPVKLLNNGDVIFPEMIKAIRAAKHSVHMMVFIWADGELSDMFLDALIDKAREGVEVRLLIDSLGGMRAPNEKMRTLEAAGADVEWFRKFEFGKLTRFHRRNHRRSIVIDGKVAFTGGISVSDEWLGNADSPEHWRDIMVRVEGVMAERLQGVFAESWAATSGELLIGDKYYPPALQVTEGAPFLSVASSPSDDEHPLRNLFWMSFASGTKSMNIANAYFVPDELIRQSLIDRAKAGVAVRILVPNRHNDVPPVLWAGRYYYQDLLEAGVRIFEYQPTMMHSKFFTIDGVWSVIGSANLDVRSKELNEENVFGISDEGFAQEIDAVFENDLTQAKEISLATWRKRGLWWRMKEAVAALFAEQF